MREWHAPHGRDGSDHDLEVPVMPTRGHSRSHEPIRDSEMQIREVLDYRRRVDAAYAADAQERTEQRESVALRERTRDRVATEKPLERPASDPETSAALAKVDERSVALPGQTAKKAKPEHSRLPSNKTTSLVVGIGMTLSAGADFLNVMPGKSEELVTAFLGTVIAGVAWGNQRWKEKHGDRSED